MNWFGRKAAGRDEARPVLSRVGMVASMGDWPRSYEAQVRDAYLSNPIAQRAVRMVVEGVGSAPINASSPEVSALMTRRSGGQALIETVAAHMLLHGNAYVQVIDDGADGIGELYALRPERVSIDADAGGWPAAYRYRVGERVSRYPAEDAPRATGRGAISRRSTRSTTITGWGA